VNEKLLRKLLRGQASVEDLVARVATSGLQELPEQNGIRLHEESAPAPLVLEEDRVAPVEAVSGSGLHEESGPLPEEEFVDDVGLTDLAVLALDWNEKKA